MWTKQNVFRTVPHGAKQYLLLIYHVAIELLHTQVFSGSVQWVLLEISGNLRSLEASPCLSITDWWLNPATEKYARRIGSFSQCLIEHKKVYETTVDGWNPKHQLRLAFFHPIIYRVLPLSQVVGNGISGCHQQYHLDQHIVDRCGNPQMHGPFDRHVCLFVYIYDEQT